MTTGKMKWVMIALLLSLGGNLYAVTYLMGHHARQHVATANLARKQLEAILKTLPRDKQTAIRADMKADIEQLHKDLRDARQDREKLTALMTADTLDQPAIDAEFGQMRKQTEQAQEDLQRITLKAFSQMTPDERKNAMEHLNVVEKKQ